LDTPVFRHVIAELHSCFHGCLDSQSLHRDIVEAEIYIDPADFPRRRCVCTLRDRLGYRHSQTVEIESANEHMHWTRR
jgi:hypothetical protein